LKKGFIGIFQFIFVLGVVTLAIFVLGLADYIWVKIVHVIDHLFSSNNTWVIIAVNVIPIIAVYLYFARRD
jgi:uncharacterized membrane protein